MARMSAYLLCLSISGGIPLFTRKNGDLKSIPFPLLASLNGVAMFGQSHDVTLLSTMTRECRLLWRDYHNRYNILHQRYECERYFTMSSYQTQFTVMSCKFHEL